jgi:hypothetical protein
VAVCHALLQSGNLSDHFLYGGFLRSSYSLIFFLEAFVLFVNIAILRCLIFVSPVAVAENEIFLVIHEFDKQPGALKTMELRARRLAIVSLIANFFRKLVPTVMDITMEDPPRDHSHWTEDECNALLDFLIERKAEMRTNLRFLDPTFESAPACVAKVSTGGRTTGACRAKYASVRGVVHR